MTTENAMQDPSPFRRQIERDVADILAAPLPWHELAGRTIMVTGATGFIGSYLIETLCALRNQPASAPKAIIAHVRSRQKALARFAGMAGAGELVILEGDVGHAIDLDQPVDVIIHAASPASPRHYLTDPVGVLRANLSGTQWLLELAARHGAKVLFFSSAEVYGQTDIVPTPENAYGYVDPTTVRACYAEGKRAAETLCVAWHHQFGTQVSMVRPFHTYGPGIALDDGRVFADFVADIVAGRDIVMHSDGLATRAFCYVTDAVRGFFTVLFHGQSGQAYNVGNPAGETSIADLADMLVALYPEKGLQVVRDASRRDQAYAQSPVIRNVPDIARLKTLGWSPTILPREGFMRMVDSYG